MDTKVVNLFGASGVGKSSGAAYIFPQLKMNGISCELVPEYARNNTPTKERKTFSTIKFVRNAERKGLMSK